MNEFDYCERSFVTAKHSNSWYCNQKCEYCGQVEDNASGMPGPSDKIDYPQDSLIATINAKHEELVNLFEEYENTRTVLGDKISDLITANALIEELRIENRFLQANVESLLQLIRVPPQVVATAKTVTSVTKEEKQRIRAVRIKAYIDAQENFVFTDEVIAAFPEYKEKHIRQAIALL